MFEFYFDKLIFNFFLLKLFYCDRFYLDCIYLKVEFSAIWGEKLFDSNFFVLSVV